MAGWSPLAGAPRRGKALAARVALGRPMPVVPVAAVLAVVQPVLTARPTTVQPVALTSLASAQARPLAALVTQAPKVVAAAVVPTPSQRAVVVLAMSG